MKLKLDMDEMSTDFFEDVRLLGIVASVKAYQFCWQLNNRLRFDFRINNQIEIQLTKKQRTYFFPIYEFPEAHNTLVHYLYINQFDGEYLLPEFRNLDFLWLLKGDTVTDGMLKHLVTTVKDIGCVQLITEIASAKIKNKGHLIF
jgi:hypothetical protein